MSTIRRLLTVAVVVALVGGTAVALAAPQGGGLNAPSKVGPYIRFSAVQKNQSQPGQKIAKMYETWSQKTAAVLSAAYGGATAVSERYSDESFETSVVLYAVRAPSPKLWTAYQDAAFLRQARPYMEVRTIGAVTCLVQNAPTPRGKTPAKDAALTLRCQRSDDRLTVIVEAQGPISHSPSGVAGLVDDAWSSLH